MKYMKNMGNLWFFLQLPRKIPEKRKKCYLPGGAPATVCGKEISFFYGKDAPAFPDKNPIFLSEKQYGTSGEIFIYFFSKTFPEDEYACG